MEKKKKNEEISVMFLSIVCWLKKYFGYTGLNILLKLKKKQNCNTESYLSRNVQCPTCVPTTVPHAPSFCKNVTWFDSATKLTAD